MSTSRHQPGAPPTMRDVATHAQVSPMTVSRALRDDPRVSPASKTRVLGAVAELGYRRNEAARNLRLGRSSGLLGLIVANLANPFYSQLALGVESHTSQLGMRVILANSHEDVAREQELAQDFASRRLDGLIVVPAGSTHAHLDPARLGGMPVVLAASPPSNVDLDAVVLDDFGGTREAIRRLIHEGHRRVGFLGLPASTWTGSERFRGYCAALEDAGIDIDERYIHRNQPDAATAEQVAGRLLNLDDPPTALFAANNRNTVGAYRAIRASGTPIGLTGFDDFELADMLTMPFSVVAYDPRELGAQTAKLICDRLEHAGRDQTPRRIVIPTTIIDYGVREPP
jgi:LacI family transcriptional regulator